MHEIIEIDGSAKSGSGTIVRLSLSLSSILKRELHINNIRAKREKPGLRPQHLKALEACCRLTGGSAENACVGADKMIFKPGKRIQGGDFRWDIGTAGSTTMMSHCLLPLGCFANRNSNYTMTGGLFQDFAPNPFHTKYVLLRLLRKISIQADLSIIKPGYVPLGHGMIKLDVEPLTGIIKPLRLREQGKIIQINGIAISSHLKTQKVSQRMAEACHQVLTQSGYKADIEIIEDESADQKGAALFVYAITDTGCLIGSDMAGRLGRTSEYIGRSVAHNLLEDIRSRATVDRFTADQLILYAGIADGESEYVIPCMNDHIETNLWLIEKILGAKVLMDGNYLKIKGIGIEN